MNDPKYFVKGLRQFTPKEIDLMLCYWDKFHNLEDAIYAYSVQIGESYFIESSNRKYGDAIYRIPTEHELEAIVEAASQLRSTAYLGNVIAELIEEQPDIEDDIPFAEFFWAS